MEKIELYIKLSSGYQIKSPLSQRPMIKKRKCVCLIHRTKISLFLT